MQRLIHAMQPTLPGRTLDRVLVLLDQEVLGAVVLSEPQQHHPRVTAVATGAANLLVVVLEGARHAQVHQQPQVGLVDTHAESAGRDQGINLVGEEGVLHAGARLPLHAGVVVRGPKARGLERSGGVLGLLPRRRVDQSRCLA